MRQYAKRAKSRRAALRLGVVLAGTTAAGAMAACGAAQEPVPAKNAGPVTLVVDNDWTGGDRVKVIQAWSEHVTKKHPSVKLDIREAGGTDKVIALFASDQQGDLIQLSEYLVPVFGPKNVLADIGPTLSSLKFDANSVFDIKEVTHANGKRHGLMTQISYFAWAYNKNYFQEAGIKEPTKDWTWNDALDIARRLSRVTDNRWGIRPNGEIYAWLHSANATYLDVKTQKVTWDAPAVKEALQFIADLVVRHRVAASPKEETEKKPSFVSGGFGIETYLQPNPGVNTSIAGKFQWEIAYPPKHPKTNKGVNLATGKPYTVTARAKTRGVGLEAVQALTAFYDKPVQDLYVGGLLVNSIPPLKSVANALLSSKDVPASYKVVLETLPNAVTYEKVPGFLDFQRAWRPEWDALLNGEATMEQATINMTRKGQAAIDQAAR